MTDQPSEAGEFGSAWNTYVERARAAGKEWPGDDWGDSALWDAWFERLLGAHEIGARGIEQREAGHLHR